MVTEGLPLGPASTRAPAARAIIEGPGRVVEHKSTLAQARRLGTQDRRWLSAWEKEQRRKGEDRNVDAPACTPTGPL